MAKTAILLNIVVLKFSLTLPLVLGIQVQISMFARKGYRLEGQIFQSMHVASLSECGQWCLKNKRCLSINYGSVNPDSQLAICELNQSTKERTSLKYDTRFTYYESLDSRPKESEKPSTISRNATSCSYYMSHGAPGVYTIFDPRRNETCKVYCHFDHKWQKSWTMVLSFTLSNNQKLLAKPFWMDKPYNKGSPNFRLYRMPLELMTNIRKLATEWRAVCNYNGTMSDGLDTVRGEFKTFNPIRNVTTGACKSVKYVNIRGTSCKDCTVKFFQSPTQFLHIDSTKSSSGSTTCTFKTQQGAATSEDNFGFYKNINPNFTCSSRNNSTTSWWFGK